MWKKKWPIVLAGGLWLMVLGLRFQSFISPSPEESLQASRPTESFVYVDVRGEVRRPGVYKVTSDSRVFDVLKRAGGLTDAADLTHINQTQVVHDGWLLKIPSTHSGETPTSDKISLNQANAKELETLPGIGPATAEAILKARESAPFQTVEDLLDVPGIGTQTLANIKALITP